MELLNEMTTGEARELFTKLGADPSNPQAARNFLVRKFHPDLAVQRGENREQAKKYEDILKTVNAAYDVLSGKTAPTRDPYQQSPQRPSYGGQGGYSGFGGGFGAGGFNRRRRNPTEERDAQKQRFPNTPEWAWAGYSGGMPDSGQIYRNDYRDVNFIKKTMWELSGHSKQEWTIWGYDGAFFRGVTTVFGSSKIFKDMAEAMYTWQTKGGNPYRCRAIFVQRRRTSPFYLIYCDDATFYDSPIEFKHQSGNSNPGNDQNFMRRLPGLLDAIVSAYDRGENPQDLKGL